MAQPRAGIIRNVVIYLALETFADRRQVTKLAFCISFGRVPFLISVSWRALDEFYPYLRAMLKTDVYSARIKPEGRVESYAFFRRISEIDFEYPLYRRKRAAAVVSNRVACIRCAL